MENYLSDEMIAQLTTYAFRLVGVIVLLFVAWIIAGWFRRVTQRGLEKANVDVTLRKFFANFVRYLVLIVAVLACLGIFGVETTSFAALLAGAGLAVGLAFQGTLSNFSSGVMLLTFRPFKVGDLVNVAGHLGVVDEIELFTTALDTLDHRRIIIPNSQIFGSTIENLTYHDVRRVDVKVGTEYRNDVDTVRAILEKVVAEEPGRVEEPESMVFLSDLGDSSINWQLRVWCKTDDYWDVWQRVTRTAKYAIEEAGMGIPFPQTDVHFDQEFVERMGQRAN